MFLTILVYIFLVALALLLGVVVVIINIELFVYAKYEYKSAKYSLRIAAKLFRRWQLLERSFAEVDAKDTIETVVQEIVETEHPRLAEIVNSRFSGSEHSTVTNKTPPGKFPTEFSPAEPEIKLRQKISTDSGRMPLLKEKTLRKQLPNMPNEKAPSGKLFTFAKNELWNNPGRNVLLLIAMLSDIKKLICYLIKTVGRAFLIKKMSIYCKFGAEDPFDTGQVAAVVYTSIYSINYLREHRRVNIDFQPDFEKESFEFDGDAIIVIKAMTALLKIIGAILGALLKGVFYYGGKIAWRIGPNYFRKPEESNIN